MSCSATATLSFVAADTRTTGLSAGVPVPLNESISLVFGNGTGAGQYNILYSGTTTLSGTSATLNLTSGLTDMWGTAIVAARIKGVWFYNAGANSMTVGGGTNPWATLITSGVIVPPGGWFGAATPDATAWAVTASTGMNLKVTGTNGDAFQLILLGANA